METAGNELPPLAVFPYLLSTCVDINGVFMNTMYVRYAGKRLDSDGKVLAGSELRQSARRRQALPVQGCQLVAA